MNSASRTKRILSIAIALICLSACTKELAPQPLAGSNKDVHGCIGSAGYLWCDKENACVRPWELAKDKGLKNTEGYVKDYCSGA
jgi:hypothetical protein